jgi:hypothetical protein
MAQAQLRPTYVIKFEPGAFLTGEIRFGYEWKLTTYKYLYTSAGFYAQEQTIDDPIQEEERPSGFQNLWRQFVKSDINKFLYTSAGYFYRDDNAVRERLQGPMLRFGLRQYFLTDYAPQGPFLFLGVHYAALFAESFDDRNRVQETLLLHKPGFSASFGYQRLLGLKKNTAVEAFAGLEYAFLIKQGTRSDNLRNWPNLPNILIYAGVGVGFAFRQKHRAW